MPILLPQSQQRLMRWKNGGGVTCEILRYPHDSSLESFDWRISVATVQQGGAFSLFPGIDRSLAMLAGNGVALDIAGMQHQLRPGDSALQFDGALAVQASLLDGAVVDFNVMTRRACYTHTLEQLTLAEPTVLRLFSHAAVLYVIRGRCTLPRDTALQAGDAVWFEATETVLWSRRPVPACN
jgi:environmental stress-induced protein Ves